MQKKKRIINDFERSSQAYFKEIGEFSPLSREEEFSLWEQYKKNNDLSAREKLVKSNLKFVASVARGYQGRGLSYADLIAEGNYGLMKAIDKFDYEKGFKTISYSVWWIRQTILEALKERNYLEGEELPQDYEKQYAEDDETENETEKEYTDTKVFDDINLNEMKGVISTLIGCLSDREKFVINNYFGLEGKDELTLEEIGKKLGLTKERVRQIKEKALKKLRSEALSNSISGDIYYK